MCTTGTLSRSTGRGSFASAGPAWFVDPLMLTNQVAFAKELSQFLNVPPHIALKVVFSSQLYRLIIPEAGAW